MPTKWVPPKIFMRLDRRDAVIYHAYKDGNYNNELLYVYNAAYYEDDDKQFDVRDLIPKLGSLGLPVNEEKTLQRCIEAYKHDNGTRGWHRGIIRLAWHHGLLRPFGLPQR